MLALPASRQQLKGEVEPDGFRIAKRIAPSSMWTLRSAFETWACGIFTPSGAGTAIRVTFYVYPGVIAFWGVVLALSLLVGLAAVTDTLQGGFGLVLVPGSFGLLSLLPRLFAIDDGPYLLQFLKVAAQADPRSQVGA